MLMALRKEPGRRYASVEQFNDDLARHLNGFPVRAGKDTVRYRTGKFITRHRFGVVISALGLLLIIAFAAAMTFQQRQTFQARVRAEEERDRAELERDKATRTSAFLMDVFELADPYRTADTVTARELMENAAKQLKADPKVAPRALAPFPLDRLGDFR
ncbi:MAG: hypothetical protein GY798_15975 [Hyphomicrobiales bacterium]|nr:hypothetical protein [Hyphomicrobiales bacterium]